MKKNIPLLLILSIMLSACTTQASFLIGKWKLVSHGSPDAMTAAVPDAEATLTFGDDGTVSGNGGCNSIGGTYEVSDEIVTFKNVLSTLMACEDARMAQENAVTHVLSGAAQFEINDRTLTIKSNGTALVFALVRLE